MREPLPKLNPFVDTPAQPNTGLPNVTPGVPAMGGSLPGMGGGQPVQQLANDIRGDFGGRLGDSNLDSLRKNAIEDSFFDYGKSDTGVSFTNNRLKLTDAYDTLSDGTLMPRFPDFVIGADNEDRLAQQQGVGQKWSRGLQKFLGKTGTAVLGGTVGSVYGIGDAIVTGDWTAIYDNSFMDYLGDLDTRMNNNLANYRKKEDRDLSFGQSLGKADFWADDFLGGLSFTVGAIATEALWATATGGASLSTTGARVGYRASTVFGKGAQASRMMKPMKEMIQIGGATNRRMMNAAEVGSRIGGTLNLSRSIYTSAGYESGVEARHFEMEQRDQFNRYFEELGREPTAEERATFENGLKDKMNSVFGTNMAIVGSSNLLLFGQIFNIKNPLKGTSKQIDRILFGKGTKVIDGQRQAIKRNLAQRIGGVTYNTLKNPFREGVFEEGLQAVTATSQGGVLSSMYDMHPETMGVMESIYEGLSHTYGTKEGWKEVGLGMLIGAFGGGGTTLLNRTNPFESIIDSAREVSTTSQNQVNTLASAGLNAEGLVDIALKGDYTESQVKLAMNIARANGLNASLDKEQEAELRGDLEGASRARREAILANIMYADATGLQKEAEEDLFLAIDSISNEELAEQLGITEDEAVQRKQELKDEYKKQRNEFEKYKRFSDNMIGNISQSDIQQIQEETGIGDFNSSTLSNALAAEMVMQAGFVEDAMAYNDAIMGIVKKSNNPHLTQMQQAASFKIAVDLAQGRLDNNMGELVRRLERVQEQLEKVEEERTSPEVIGGTDSDRRAIQRRINKLDKKEKELQEEFNDLQRQFDLNMTALDINRLFPERQADFISIDPLELSRTLTEMEQLMNTGIVTDPIENARLHAYSRAYNKAVRGARNVDEVLKGFLDPKVGLKGASRTFALKATKFNEPTKKIIGGLARIHNQLVTDAMVRDMNRQVMGNIAGDTTDDVEVIQNDTPITDETFDQFTETGDVSESVLQSIADDIQTSTPLTERKQAIYQAHSDKVEEILKSRVPQNDANVIEKIDERINEMLQKDGVVEEVNTVEDIEAARPTNAEVDRYLELLKKIGELDQGVFDSLRNQRDFDNLKMAMVDNNEGELTPEELEELRSLSEKLSNWQFINIIGDEVTVRDLLEQRARLGGVISEDGIENIPPDQEFAQSMSNSSITNQNISRPKFVLTPDSIVARQAEEDGTVVFEVSHLRLDDPDMLAKLASKGVTVIQDSPGIYVISKGDQQVRIEKTSQNRLRTTSKQDFDMFLDMLDMKAYKDPNRGGQWFMVFEKTDKGTYKLAQGNFTVGNVDFPDINFLSPEELYNLQPGDDLAFVLDLRDSYNQQLIQQHSGKEDFADVFNTNALVYVVDSKGNIVGYLKVATGFESNQAIEQIREDLVGQITDIESSQKIILPYTAKVGRVFINQPNVEITEADTLEQHSIPLEAFTSDQLPYKIEAFGVYDPVKKQIRYNDNYDNLDQKPNMQQLRGVKKNVGVMVIRQGSQLIAYPVRLNVKGQLSDLNQAFDDYMTMNVSINRSTPDKIGVISDFLRQYGLNPADYNVYYLSEEDNFFTDPDNMAKVRQALARRSGVFLPSDILDESFTAENFVEVATSSLIFDDLPFTNAKIMINERSVVRTTGERTVESFPLPIDQIVQVTAAATNPAEVEELIRLMDHPGTLEKFETDESYRRYIINTSINTHIIPIKQVEGSTYTRIIRTFDPFAFEELEADRVRIAQKLAAGDLRGGVADLMVLLAKVGIDTDMIDLDAELRDELTLERFAFEALEVVNNPTPEGMERFATFLEGQVVKPDTIMVNMKVDKPSSLVYYDTRETELEVFQRHRLIKTQGENIYMRVDDKSLEELYQEVEDIGMIPEGANPQTYVLGLANLFEITDNEVAQKFILNKLAQNIPVVTPVVEKQLESTTKKKIDYLRNGFESDFAKDWIENKLKKTPLWDSFYSLFTVDHKGIRPIDDKEETRQQILDNVPSRIRKDLVNYIALSRHTDMDLNQSPEFDPNVDLEQQILLQAVNNPNMIDRPNNPVYRTDNPDEFMTISNEEFLRLGDQVYQKVLSGDNVGLYMRIENNKTVDFAATEASVAETDKAVTYLKTYEPSKEDVIERTNYLSTRELEDLNNDEFDCD